MTLRSNSAPTISRPLLQSAEVGSTDRRRNQRCGKRTALNYEATALTCRSKERLPQGPEQGALEQRQIAK